MEILKGIGVGPGFAIGESFVLDSEEPVVPVRFIMEEDTENELLRFQRAVEQATDEIRGIQEKVEADVGKEAKPIFDAHILMLGDQALHEEVRNRIRNNRFTAEYAVQRSLAKFAKAFMGIRDQYLSQRVSDIMDIEKRLLNALLGQRHQDMDHLTHPVVLVAHDLSPSQTANLDKSKVLGFATDIGGPAGHTAIVARAMEIPAVVGLDSVSADATNGDMVIVDGHRGIVIIGPDEKTVERYHRMADDYRSIEARLIEEKDLPAVTSDGTEVTVLANIEMPVELPGVLEMGGEGVGLYRSEFLYVSSKDVDPGEEEHLEAYRQAVETLDGLPLTIRTMDLGADKFPERTSSDRERNPFLGMRSIRYCLRFPEKFRLQVRAILRAGAIRPGTIKMMVPMISAVDELVQVREIVTEVMRHLDLEGVDYEKDMPLGMMVEVPSAALTLDHFAGVADFFSVGTNDLTQYTLAVDRTNDQMAQLYQPGHPSVLKLIKMSIDAGAAHDIPVSVCGEIAGDPTFVVALLGMGLRTFSVSSPLIPEVKKLIRLVSMKKAREVADTVLEMGSARDVVTYLRRMLREIQPDWKFI